MDEMENELNREGSALICIPIIIQDAKISKSSGEQVLGVKI
jgi:hypothetical protein